MTTSMGDAALLITNDGVGTTYPNGKYATLEITRNWQFSLEMIRFLINLERGSFDVKSKDDQRCLAVASRKGCYSPRILNSTFGFFTEGYGEKALLDAKIINEKLTRFYMENIGHALNLEEVTTMEQIVPYGIIPKRSIELLRFLWETLPEHTKTLKPNRITEPTEAWLKKTITDNGRTYIIQSLIRNNASIRIALEMLYKFGLCHLVEIPPLNGDYFIGRGRPRVGYIISPFGKLFYEDYLSHYDASILFHKRMSEPIIHDDEEVAPNFDNDSARLIPPGFEFEIPESTRKLNEAIAEKQNAAKQKSYLSDSSDIVDGENLRDLFG